MESKETKDLKGNGNESRTSVRLNKLSYEMILRIQLKLYMNTDKKVSFAEIIRLALNEYESSIKVKNI